MVTVMTEIVQKTHILNVQMVYKSTQQSDCLNLGINLVYSHVINLSAIF